MPTKYRKLIDLCGAGKKTKLVSFYESFERRIMEMPDAYQIKEYERLLSLLDDKSWNDLKTKVLRNENVSADAVYGYAFITDCLNEAYGYEYLKQQGYKDVSFIQETAIKTPDLIAVLNDKPIAVLDVKTIRASFEEMDYYRKISEKIKVGALVPGDIRCISFNFDSEINLPNGFQNKLKKDIESARAQLDAHWQNSTRRIVYFCIQIDGKLLTGTPYDKRLADKVGSFLSELANDMLEIQYRFVGGWSGYLQNFK